MDKIVIIGGTILNGSVEISGAKNAVLPVMAATLLASGKYRISRVPNLRDTRTMIRLLEIIGADISFDDDLLTIDTTGCNNPEAPYDLVKTMRASFYVLGPLLSRFGYAKVSLPGGCAWGPRPVNLHLSAVQALGAETSLKEGFVVAKGEKLSGNLINFEISSVGATGNAVMAAVRAEGETVVKNAAREPEIVALCDFINAMGGQASGMGTDTLIIRGVKSLQATDFEIIPDRIEAATFLIAGAIMGQTVSVRGVIPDHISAVLERLRAAGNDITISTDSVTIKRGKRIRPVDVTTSVYPGFPTDVQAQWMTLMALADGNSTIVDTIYRDRFTHVSELSRLGAEIKRKDNTVRVFGTGKLIGAPVMSTDIRASASLILAGLAAEGRTDISRVYHIDRGYEKIEDKFRMLGADIWREAG